MRILLLADVSPGEILGGAERVLHEHSTRLQKRGHQVTVLCRKSKKDDPDEIETEGVRVVQYAVTRTTPLTFLWTSLSRSLRLLRTLLRTDRFDLLCAYQPFSALAMTLSPEVRAHPRIYTFLSPASEEYGVRRRPGVGIVSRLLKEMEGYSLRRAGRILILSEYSRGQLGEIHGLAGDRIVTIPGGVDTDRFRPAESREKVRRHLGEDPSSFLLLTVRNLEPRMGLDNLLQAMALLTGRLPTARLLVAGAGSLRQILEEQIRRLDLTRRVALLGYIPEENLPLYYQAADYFLLPTRLLEGFGLVTLEALSCGTPVLGTPVGGTVEILSGLAPDLLFPGTDPLSMATLIEKRYQLWKENPTDYVTLRDLCRRYVEERYSWERIIPRLETALEGTRR